MKYSIVLTLLIALLLATALPLVQHQFYSEKAFTSDNLICTLNSNM
jgi:Mg/Co/Ni transporter MgtE